MTLMGGAPACRHSLGEQLGDSVAGAGTGGGVQRRAVIGRSNIDVGLVPNEELWQQRAMAVAGSRQAAQGVAVQGPGRWQQQQQTVEPKQRMVHRPMHRPGLLEGRA